jgi:hypothetical protein
MKHFGPGTQGGRNRVWAHGISSFASKVRLDERVVYFSSQPLTATETCAAPMPQFAASRDVKCQITKMASVCIPVPSLTSHPPPSGDEDALVDWNTNMAALFEWVGMACLGSQRYSSDSFPEFSMTIKLTLYCCWQIVSKRPRGPVRLGVRMSCTFLCRRHHAPAMERFSWTRVRSVCY